VERAVKLTKRDGEYRCLGDAEVDHDRMSDRRLRRVEPVVSEQIGHVGGHRLLPHSLTQFLSFPCLASLSLYSSLSPTIPPSTIPSFCSLTSAFLFFFPGLNPSSSLSTYLITFLALSASHFSRPHSPSTFLSFPLWPLNVSRSLLLTHSASPLSPLLPSPRFLVRIYFPSLSFSLNTSR
jgi:hypothetical protein